MKSHLIHIWRLWLHIREVADRLFVIYCIINQ